MTSDNSSRTVNSHSTNQALRVFLRIENRSYQRLTKDYVTGEDTIYINKICGIGEETMWTDIEEQAKWKNRNIFLESAMLICQGDRSNYCWKAWTLNRKGLTYSPT